MALTTPNDVGAAAAASITRSLTGKSTDRKGKAIEVVLVLAMLASLLLLAVLLVHLWVRAWPVLSDDFRGFLGRGQDSSSAVDAGIGQAIRGTIILSVIFAAILGSLSLQAYAGRFLQALTPESVAIKPLASELFTTYLLPFEIIGLLLLAAVVGATVLARKQDSVSPEEE